MTKIAKILVVMVGFVFLLGGVEIGVAGLHMDQGVIDGDTEHLLKPDSGSKADENFNALVLRVINVLLYFAAGLAVLSLVIGSVKMVKGMGNEEALSEGKRVVVWTLAGLAVVILSFAIVNTILKALFAIE